MKLSWTWLFEVFGVIKQQIAVCRRGAILLYCLVSKSFRWEIPWIRFLCRKGYLKMYMNNLKFICREILWLWKGFEEGKVWAKPHIWEMNFGSSVWQRVTKTQKCGGEIKAAYVEAGGGEMKWTSCVWCCRETEKCVMKEEHWQNIFQFGAKISTKWLILGCSILRKNLGMEE